MDSHGHAYLLQRLKIKGDKFNTAPGSRLTPGTRESQQRTIKTLLRTLPALGLAIAPDEIRGKEIRGGEIRRIGKGDIIIVPLGVPHWFKQVDAPLLYYVVKVTSAK